MSNLQIESEIIRLREIAKDSLQKVLTFLL